MEPYENEQQGSSECDEVGFKGTLVSGVGSFRLFLTGSPFRPRPLGKPVLANAERFGTFFDFWNWLMNSSSMQLTSATAIT